MIGDRGLGGMGLGGMGLGGRGLGVRDQVFMVLSDGDQMVVDQVNWVDYVELKLTFSYFLHNRFGLDLNPSPEFINCFSFS